MKKVLCSLFKDHGLGFCASGRRGQRKAWDPEYLVDVAVYEKRGGMPAGSALSYKGLTLACEIEWSADRYAREYDFAKLADVRSDRKVFIGMFRSGKERDPFRPLLAFLNGHRGVPKREQFLVVLGDYDTKDHDVTIRILEKGRRNPIEIRKASS